MKPARLTHLLLCITATTSVAAGDQAKRVALCFFGKEVRSLLVRQCYGERWLDLVRDSESDGYYQDAYRPHECLLVSVIEKECGEFTMKLNRVDKNAEPRILASRWDGGNVSRSLLHGALMSPVSTDTISTP